MKKLNVAIGVFHASFAGFYGWLAYGGDLGAANLAVVLGALAALTWIDWER